MNAPLPQICCPNCYLRQPFRLQTHCIHCQKELRMSEEVNRGRPSVPLALSTSLEPAHRLS
jgi:hypothetical protein